MTVAVMFTYHHWPVKFPHTQLVLISCAFNWVLLMMMIMVMMTTYMQFFYRTVALLLESFFSSIFKKI